MNILTRIKCYKASEVPKLLVQYYFFFFNLVCSYEVAICGYLKMEIERQA